MRLTLEKKSAYDLANCISVLREKAENSADITLICQEKRFLVHKAILTARSDVFSALFSHTNTKEATTKEVCIDDTDPGTLERFLGYVHLWANMIPICEFRVMIKYLCFLVTSMEEICEVSHLKMPIV